LKGSDAIVFKKLAEANLNPRVGTAVYQYYEDEIYLVDEKLKYCPFDVDELSFGESDIETQMRKYNEKISSRKLIKKVVWLKKPSDKNANVNEFPTYGNEPSIGQVYLNFVIIFGRAKYSPNADADEEDNETDDDDDSCAVNDDSDDN
jgi:hypothetical protein